MRLTVAIPTFNGERFIAETITSVTSQIGIFDDVEVLVLDNASVDRTAEIVRSLQPNCKNLRLEQNKSTVQVNHNIRLAVEHAVGEYVWILADDDVLVSGGLQRVLAQIDVERPSLVIVGFENVDQDLSPLASLSEADQDLAELDRVQQRPSNYGKRSTSTQVFYKAEDALENIGFQVFGLISSIITRRDAFLDANIKLGEPVIGGFDFLCLVPMVMATGTTVFIRESTVKFRHYEKRWLSDDNYSQAMWIYFIVIPHVLRRLKNQFGYQKVTINKIHFLHLANFTLQLSIARAKGWRASDRFVKDLLSANSWNWLILVQLPFLWLPTNLLKAISRVYSGAIANRLRSILKTN
jgi:glycosyltransferase involved in cell wall biosynthesis